MSSAIQIADLEIDPLKCARAISESLYWDARMEVLKGEGMTPADREQLIYLQTALLAAAETDQVEDTQ